MKSIPKLYTGITVNSAINSLVTLSTTNHKLTFKPLKGRGVNWLHLAIQVSSIVLLSDIWTLWRSALSARVPKCHKLKMAG